MVWPMMLLCFSELASALSDLLEKPISDIPTHSERYRRRDYHLYFPIVESQKANLGEPHMLEFLLACFIVGLLVVSLFSGKTRSAISGVFRLVSVLIVITVVGAFAIAGAIYLLLNF